RYPNTRLQASGLAVGLPEGQMGNSEVGHMNIGAGRIVYQDLVRINKALKEGELDQNPVLNEAFDYAKKNGRKVHFIGLVSDGGVHSHIEHLKGLISLAHSKGVGDLFVHAFLDGRDTDPRSGLGFLKELIAHLSANTGHLASVIGRDYARDRDKRWERMTLAYDLPVNGQGEKTHRPLDAVPQSYDNNVTDEFVKPICVTDERGEPVATIREGDVVLCFNFRTDRGRQITQALTQQDFPEHQMAKLALHYITMTVYDDSFKGVRTIFQKDNLENTLGQVIADAGLKQIRIAETEKYPHVTFFFSGGRETVFPGETRILCPSPK